jgi:hypothetical protein
VKPEGVNKSEAEQGQLFINCVPLGFLVSVVSCEKCQLDYDCYCMKHVREFERGPF